jgi:peptidoglycan hydrolase-like protein with peptidoglycan-binding domain
MLNSDQTIVSTSSSSTVYFFTTDLTIGLTGDDVIALQKFLVSKNFLVMPVGVSMGYFGNITKMAVAKWQTSSGITPALGYFGPKSMAFIKAYTKNTTLSQPQPAAAIGVSGGGGNNGICEAQSGKCFYVATDGNDSNPGTFASPFKTFKPALTAVSSGDIIYARGGTYSDDNSESPGPYGNSMMAILDDGSYTVKNGSANAPIIVKNYPNEIPVLSGADAKILIVLKSYWTIQGFDLDGSKLNFPSQVYIGGGTQSAQTHDITIINNKFHDFITWNSSSNNVGMIKIDRGDYDGGPYNINILNNTFHDMSDPANPGVWSGLSDMQHYGAVTVLSCQIYISYDCQGNGAIVISGNEIYHLPQALFFKNPMQGPITIQNNIIHDSDALGVMNASNATLKNNLVYNVPVGFWVVGDSGGINDQRINSINGRNLVINNNTFVGLNLLLGIRDGTGESINNNVFFGLKGETQGADWNTTALIEKNIIDSSPDSLDPAQSALQQIHSDNNCYFVATPDAQIVSRYLPAVISLIGDVLINQAQSIFGFDKNSKFTVETNENNVFVNPSSNNFNLINPSICSGAGYSQ